MKLKNLSICQNKPASDVGLNRGRKAGLREHLRGPYVLYAQELL